MDNIYQIYSSNEKLNFLLQKIDSLTKDVHVLKQQLNKLSSHSSNQSINSIKPQGPQGPQAFNNDKHWCDFVDDIVVVDESSDFKQYIKNKHVRFRCYEIDDEDCYYGDGLFCIRYLSSLEAAIFLFDYINDDVKQFIKKHNSITIRLYKNEIRLFHNNDSITINRNYDLNIIGLKSEAEIIQKRKASLKLHLSRILKLMFYVYQYQKANPKPITLDVTCRNVKRNNKNFGYSFCFKYVDCNQNNNKYRFSIDNMFNEKLNSKHNFVELLKEFLIY